MSLRLKSCDHQGQGYIGTLISKQLSLVTWPEYAAKMQSFINLGRKIYFFKFCDVTVTL